MTRNSLYFAFVAALVAPACGGSQPAPAEPTPAPATPPTAAAPDSLASATPPPSSDAKPTGPTATKEETPPPGPKAAVRFTGAFATPESVLYDEAGDRYLVSNINGKPSDADGNGYISVLSPDGQVTNPKWIAAGVKKAKLDAPKGMAIVQGVLYVADLTAVRKFDLKDGTPKGDIPIEGATFLNDVSVAADGKIYVSDTGMKGGSSGLEPNGTDAVYVIEKGKVRPLAKFKDLAGPNGLLATESGVLVTSFATSELYRLDNEGKRKDITPLPEGGLDGIVAVEDTLLVASWKGSAIYRGRLRGVFEVLVANIKTPADIGFDKKRSRVLVPRFTEDVVEAYDVK
jgi:sugar lactone lactonase YvrE